MWQNMLHTRQGVNPSRLLIGFARWYNCTTFKSIFITNYSTKFLQIWCCLRHWWNWRILDGQVPQWKEAPDGGEYYPSTNVPPTAYTPILINGERVRSYFYRNEFFLSPIMLRKLKKGFLPYCKGLLI